MTISLGGLVLSDDLIIENIYNAASIGQSENITIGGSPVVHSDPQSGGRNFLLTTHMLNGHHVGTFTTAQLDTLKAHETSGSEIVFIYETQTFNIKIKAGGFNVKPLLPKANQSATDLHVGSITLIEV